MKVVVVMWKDAHADCQGWSELGDIDDEPYIVRSVGFLLTKGHGKKKGHVSIAQSISEDKMIDSVLHIPKRMVVSLAVLELERESDGEASEQARGGGNHRISEDSQAKRV